MPDLTCNLFSVGACTNRGNSVTFNSTGCDIKGKNDILLGKGIRVGDKLYQLKCKNVLNTESACIVEDVNLWHQRLGHLNYKQLQELKYYGMVRTSKRQASSCHI